MSLKKCWLVPFSSSSEFLLESLMLHPSIMNTDRRWMEPFSLQAASLLPQCETLPLDFRREMQLI